MKKMILLQIEYAEKEIREAKNQLDEFENRKIWHGLVTDLLPKLYARLNFYNGYRVAMQICLRELEERENIELEKMYEEQKNNL